MLPRHPMLRREARRSIDLSHKATTFTHLLRRRRERWCAYPLPALSRGEGRVRGRVSSHRRRFAITRPLIPPSPRQERGEGVPLAPHHRRRVNLIACKGEVDMRSMSGGGLFPGAIPCKIPTPNGLRPFGPPLFKLRDTHIPPECAPIV